MKKAAFSLVELSIVLVILGLLVGGILAGQSLIRASELRSVIEDARNYNTAMMAFRDKYFAIPGDFSRATSLWGDNNSECADAAIADGTPGACNGNGSGIIEAPNAGAPVNAGMGHTAEMHQFWNQLALAGLIPGKYTGLAGTNDPNGWGTTQNVNAPGARIPGAVWKVTGYYGAYAASSDYYYTDMGNNFMFTGNTNGQSRILSATDAWNIDMKADDGLPARGKLRNIYYNGCTTSANSTDYDGLYQLSYAGLACALRWKWM